MPSFVNLTVFAEKAALWGFKREMCFAVSHILMMPKSQLGLSAVGGVGRGTVEHLQRECNRRLSASVN